MTLQTEPVYAGEFLLSEDNGHRSREVVTLDQNQTVVPGSVLGQKTVGALSVAAAKIGTGNGAITGAVVAAGSQVGAYVATCVGAAANAGEFILQSPTGEELGSVAVGTPFTLGGITATIADGSADWVVGDQVTYTVTAAAGNGDYVLVNPSATDGSQIASAIAWDATTTGAGVTAKIQVVKRAAEVKAASLNWNGASAPQIAAGILQLAGLGVGIIARS